jgi:chlorobactene glucosyltransferase
LRPHLRLEPFVLTPLLYALPWVILPGVILWRLSRSTHLNAESAEAGKDAPFVSVICPARNEARHIEGFVRAALGSTYPRFELIVVDDHSTDGTGAMARAAAGDDSRLKVIVPPPLPKGWFGKQWACHAGAQQARGDILLFTDADTRHGAELVVRSVNCMRRRGSELLSVAGRQELGSFWERVIQPAIFAALFSTFGGTEAVSNATNRRYKIANGQYLMVRAETYYELGGHERVRGYAAEDLMLAQQWCAVGKAVHLVAGLDYLSTRMYEGLSEIIAGWSKNAWAAGRHMIPDSSVMRGVMRLLMPLSPILVWGPFAALVLGALGLAPLSWTVFGAVAYGAVTVYLLALLPMMGVPIWYAFLHPLGAVMSSYIYLLAAIRGDRVRWKDRTYSAH